MKYCCYYYYGYHDDSEGGCRGCSGGNGDNDDQDDYDDDEDNVSMTTIIHCNTILDKLCIVIIRPIVVVYAVDQRAQALWTVSGH